MSLLNDALRKKRNETEIKEDVHFNPKPRASHSVKKIKLSGVCLLLLLLGGLVFGGWYFLGLPFAQTDSSLAASRVAQDVEINESNSISEPNFNNKEKVEPIEPDTIPPKPLREIKPLQEPVATETIKKDKQTAKNRSEKAPPPPAKQVENKPRSVKKKPLPKPAKTKDRPPAKEKVRSPPSHSHQEGLFLRKAFRYHRQGKLSQAIQMYQQVLSVKPDHQDALFNLASAYIQLSSYSEAYPLLKKLRRQDYGNPDILVNLAIVEIGLENPAEAIHLLDTAAKQYEGPNFGIYFHRAAALSRLGRLEEARNSYKKAKELNPRHPTVLFNLAVLCDKLHKYNEAVDYYQAFLKHNDTLSHDERKNIEARIRSLRAYLAGKGN
jgi:tetratricopeptide (TPR) repeat protein